MVLQLLRVSVLVRLVGFPLMLDGRTLEEHPQVFVSVLNDDGRRQRHSSFGREAGVVDLRTGRFVDYLEKLSRAAGGRANEATIPGIVSSFSNLYER